MYQTREQEEKIKANYGKKGQKTKEKNRKGDFLR